MLAAEVLVRLADGVPPTALDGPLEREVERLRAALPAASVEGASSLLHHRRAAEEAGNDLAPVDGIVDIGGLPPAWARVPIDSFDAVVELRWPDGGDPEAGLAALDGLVGRLGGPGVVDVERSAAGMGTAHPIIDGPGAVRFFYCFRARPPVTHDEFSAYWLGTLTEQTTKTPGKAGYVQLHLDPGLTRRAAAAAGVAVDGYDGIALEWFPDVPAFMEAVAWGSEPDAPIIRSEGNINDFESSLSMVAYVPGARS